MAKPKTLKWYDIFFTTGGRGWVGSVQATSPTEAKHKAVMQWGRSRSDYRTVQSTKNPRRNPPKGWIPATAVKITRKNGKVTVRVRRAKRANPRRKAQTAKRRRRNPESIRYRGLTIKKLKRTGMWAAYSRGENLFESSSLEALKREIDRFIGEPPRGR
jgi:hypothetical protein